MFGMVHVLRGGRQGDWRGAAKYSNEGGLEVSVWVWEVFHHDQSVRVRGNKVGRRDLRGSAEGICFCGTETWEI